MGRISSSRQMRSGNDYLDAASKILIKGETPFRSTDEMLEMNTEFTHDLVKLSYLKNGPLLAGEFLMKKGIHFVVEPHLKGTHLDGAVLLLPNGSPVIALTIRYDRTDNFWFTLFHELAHLALHIKKGDCDIVYDDLDQERNDSIETDADNWATKALIPDKEWAEAHLDEKVSKAAVLMFAEKLSITPSIPAGRIRRQYGCYKKFNNLIGNNEVRKLFIEA